MTQRIKSLPNRDTCKKIVEADGPLAGEPIFAPYLYEAALDGLADEVLPNGGVVFDIDDADVLRGFPELESVDKVTLYIEENGQSVWTVAE